MPSVASHGMKLAKPLNQRREVTVELPEFLIRAIHARADEANENELSDDDVQFNHVIEWLLVSEVTIRRLPHLESSIPGFTAAMAAWLLNATYAGPEEHE